MRAVITFDKYHTQRFLKAACNNSGKVTQKKELPRVSNMSRYTRICNARETECCCASRIGKWRIYRPSVEPEVHFPYLRVAVTCPSLVQNESIPQAGKLALWYISIIIPTIATTYSNWNFSVIHNLDFSNLSIFSNSKYSENTTFWKLSLFPSSCKGTEALCWVFQKMFTSFTGPCTQQSRCFLQLIWWQKQMLLRKNCVFLVIQNSWRWIKSINPMMLKVVYHRQKLLE